MNVVLFPATSALSSQSLVSGAATKWGNLVSLRDSYKHLLTYHPSEETEEISHPGKVLLMGHFLRRLICFSEKMVYPLPLFLASKRPRMDPAASRVSHVTHLSPTACCVAIGSRDSVQLYHLGGTVMGLKGQLPLN